MSQHQLRHAQQIAANLAAARPDRDPFAIADVAISIARALPAEAPGTADVAMAA
jgi:hypothetical protein